MLRGWVSGWLEGNRRTGSDPRVPFPEHFGCSLLDEPKGWRPASRGSKGRDANTAGTRGGGGAASRGDNSAGTKEPRPTSRKKEVCHQETHIMVQIPFSPHTKKGHGNKSPPANRGNGPDSISSAAWGPLNKNFTGRGAFELARWVSCWLEKNPAKSRKKYGVKSDENTIQ